MPIQHSKEIKVLTALCTGLSLFSAALHANENPAVVDALSGYMDFAEYGSSLAHELASRPAAH